MLLEHCGCWVEADITASTCTVKKQIKPGAQRHRMTTCVTSINKVNCLNFVCVVQQFRDYLVQNFDPDPKLQFLLLAIWLMNCEDLNNWWSTGYPKKGKIRFNWKLWERFCRSKKIWSSDPFQLSRKYREMRPLMLRNLKVWWWLFVVKIWQCTWLKRPSVSLTLILLPSKN